MNRIDVDREEYGLLVLIEQMQRAGRTEREIESAVRDVAPGRRFGNGRPQRRPSRFELMVRRPRV
jgi:hypothetical protein